MRSAEDGIRVETYRLDRAVLIEEMAIEKVVSFRNQVPEVFISIQ